MKGFIHYLHMQGQWVNMTCTSKLKKLDGQKC